MKKIFVNASCLNSGKTGISIALLRLLEIISKFSIDDFEIILILKSKIEYLSHFKQVVIIPKFKIFSGVLWSNMQLRLFLKKQKKNDIFFQPNQWNVPICVKPKYILAIWDIAPLSSGDENWNKHKIWFHYKFILRKAINKSYKILTYSFFIRDEIINYFNIDHNKVVTIYPGINNDFSNVIKNSNPKIEYNTKNLLYVGAITKRKNMNTLIAAFRILRNRGYNFKLILKIGLNDKKQIKDLIESYMLPLDSYEIIGYVSENKLREIYLNSHLFIFPSLYEGFGMPPLEAMSCGIPAICFNIGAMKETILIPELKAIEISALALANKIIEVSEIIINENNRIFDLIKENVSKFSWKKYLVEFLELLR